MTMSIGSKISAKGSLGKKFSEVVNFAVANESLVTPGFFAGSKSQFERELALPVILGAMSEQKSTVITINLPSDGFAKMIGSGIDSLKEGGYVAGKGMSPLYVTGKLLMQLSRSVDELKQDFMAMDAELAEEGDVHHPEDSPAASALFGFEHK